MLLKFTNLPSWVINLNRSHERWHQCVRSIVPLFTQGSCRRLPAIDGNRFIAKSSEDGLTWDTGALKRLQHEGYIGKQHSLDPVRTALCLSHQRALGEFLASGAPWGVIFEDDVRPGEALSQLLAGDGILDIPRDAELLFLHDRVKSRGAASMDGLSLEPSPARSPDVMWRHVRGGIGLEAYAVSATGARKILSAWRPLVLECDLQLMAFVSGYSDPEERAKVLKTWHLHGGRRPPSIQAYSPRRPLFQVDASLPSEKLRTIEQASKNGHPHRNGTQAQLPKDRANGFPLKSDLPEGPFNRKPKFSFCITCKDRLEHLTLTLLHNIEQIRQFGESEIVLLNYNSQDGLDEYVRTYCRDALHLRLLKYARTRAPTRYNTSHSKNVCHKLGSGDYLINLDADHYLNEGYLRELLKATNAGAEICTFVYDASIYGGGYGRVAIKKDLFIKLGGHDEDHHGYGHEDIDLVTRAGLLGVRHTKIDPSTASFIRHDDSLRNLRGPDRGHEASQWEAFFRAKWDRGELIANAGREWGTLPDLSVMPGEIDLTVVIANYRRGANLPLIFDHIPQGAEIVLLDNAPAGMTAPPDVINRTTCYVRSDGNDPVLRWLLACRSRSRYFCIHDDDLCIKNWQPYLQKIKEVPTLVGPFGVELNRSEPRRCYSKGVHTEESGMCDVIKGRAVFGRTDLLRHHFSMSTLGEVSIANDDVYISSLFGVKHHVVGIAGNVHELPDNDAVSRRRAHLDRRDEFCHRYILQSSAEPAAVHRLQKRSQVSRGVVLCASSNYHELAMAAVASVRRCSPGLPVYCHPANEGYSSRSAKLSMDLWSPFEETLFIDCDTLVCEPLDPLFDLLTQGSLYMARETPKYTSLGRITRAGWLSESFGEDYATLLRELPEDAPVWNSGVILFRKCDRVHTYFDAWRNRWELRGSRTLDQLPLAEIVMELGPPDELPPYWHCQVSSQNPRAPIPEAAIYHFMGTNKEDAMTRWHQARGAKLSTNHPLLKSNNGRTSPQIHERPVD